MQFDKQPTGNGLFRSPVLYVVNDAQASNPALTNFRYTFEVRLWTGALASKPASATCDIEIRPDDNGRAMLNVARLMDSELGRYLHATLLNAGALTIINTGAAIWCEVTANYTSDQSTGTPVVSDSFVFSRGYSTFIENQTNKTIPQGFLYSGDRQYIVQGQIAVVPCYNWNVADSDTLSVTVNQGGGTLATIALNNAQDHQNSDAAIQHLCLDWDDLVLAGVDMTQDFDIRLEDLADPSVLLDTLPVTPICEKYYDVKTISYVNRWGGVQTVLFEKRSREDYAFQRRDYDRRAISATGDVRLERGQTRNFFSDTILNHTLNTGLRGEGYNEAILDLLSSLEVIYYDDPTGTTYLVVPMKQQQERLTGVNNKTKINWEVQFEVSNTYINNIE